MLVDFVEKDNKALKEIVKITHWLELRIQKLKKKKNTQFAATKG